MPAFLRFMPVRVRAQHNGWTAKRQVRFIVALARGAGVGEAARLVGMTRQTAYRLRERPDAASFGAAWDNAIEFSRRVERGRRSQAVLSGTIETVFVPRYYRGRLIGYVQREDLAGAMRELGRLDRLAERLGDPQRLMRRTIEEISAAAGSDRSDALR